MSLEVVLAAAPSTSSSITDLMKFVKFLSVSDIPSVSLSPSRMWSHHLSSWPPSELVEASLRNPYPSSHAPSGDDDDSSITSFLVPPGDDEGISTVSPLLVLVQNGDVGSGSEEVLEAALASLTPESCFVLVIVVLILFILFKFEFEF